MNRPKRAVAGSIRERFGLAGAEIAYWDSLTSAEQERYYSDALADIRFSVVQENAYGKRGQRGRYGAGCTLAEAVTTAFSKSPPEIARRRAENERSLVERAATLHECRTCGQRVPERYALCYGGAAWCFPCCRGSGIGTLSGLIPAETAAEREALKAAREVTV